jgi:hypothetical protein
MISTAKGRPPWNETLPDYSREKNAMVRDAGRKAIQIADEEGVCICYGELEASSPADTRNRPHCGVRLYR